MTAEQKAQRLRIICGILIFLSILFEKLVVGWEYYSIWDIIFKLRDGSLEVGGPEGIIRLCTLIPMLFANILYLIRSVWFMNKKNPKYFEFLPMVSLIIYFIAFFAQQLYMVINVTLVAFDYMGARWLEERDAINRAYEEQKRRERADKEEKKRVHYFPGQYPKEFFRVIRKNTAYGKREKMILSAGCLLCASCMYITLTVYSLITQVHGKEDILSRNGLVQSFQQTEILVILFLVLLQTMIISYYIRDQKRAMRLFTILGMRSSTISLMFAIVFAVNAFLSGVAGMVFGGAIAHIIKEIWQSGLTHSGVEITLASVVSVKTVGLGILGYLLIILLALGFNQENILNLSRSMNMNAEIQREKRIKKYSLLYIGFGIILSAAGIRWYFSRSWAESMYIHIFSVLGILLLLIGGIALYLNRLEKNKERYYRKLISSRPFYYRYWKSLWNFFYLSVIHFFILAVFIVQFTGSLMKEDITDLYPYDIVCTAYDTDLEKLAEIANEHDAKTKIYPMFRMTSVYGSDILSGWMQAGARPIQWPQGQHIAISTSTYQQLKKGLGKTPQEIVLSGDEMHVVYQQDLTVKAHTIDWDTSRITKRLRIGQPLTFYNPSDIDNVFPGWKVKSEERDILTGTFHQGMGDNLIVFNDSYFEKEYKKLTAYNKKQWEMRETASFEDWRFYTQNHTSNMTEGPTQLVCYTVPEKEYAGMLADMQYLEEKYQYDRMWDDSIHPFYGKQQRIVDTGAQIFFKRLIYLFIVLLLAVLGFFQYYVKVESETKEMNWQNTFLEKLGMREKDRRKALTGQMKLFTVLPLVIGGCGGIIFAALTARARLYTPEDMSMFVRIGTVVYLIYLGLWIVWHFWMKRLIWRRMQWEK